MRSPFTTARALSCVLRGSEKETEGGDRKGGGKGRGARLANKPMPVSKRNGSRGRFGRGFGSICALLGSSSCSSVMSVERLRRGRLPRDEISTMCRGWGDRSVHEARSAGRRNIRIPTAYAKADHQGRKTKLSSVFEFELSCKSV